MLVNVHLLAALAAVRQHIGRHRPLRHRCVLVGGCSRSVTRIRHRRRGEISHVEGNQSRGGDFCCGKGRQVVRHIWRRPSVVVVVVCSIAAAHTEESGLAPVAYLIFVATVAGPRWEWRRCCYCCWRCGAGTCDSTCDSTCDTTTEALPAAMLDIPSKWKGHGKGLQVLKLLSAASTIFFFFF